MSKLTSLAEAAQLVRDGDTLALGGMTLYRRPVAFVQELLRRESPPRDLTLLCFTGPVTGNVELQDDRVMDHPIYCCCGSHRVLEDLLPL